MALEITNIITGEEFNVKEWHLFTDKQAISGFIISFEEANKYLNENNCVKLFKINYGSKTYLCKTCPEWMFNNIRVVTNLEFIELFNKCKTQLAV